MKDYWFRICNLAMAVTRGPVRTPYLRDFRAHGTAMALSPISWVDFDLHTSYYMEARDRCQFVIHARTLSVMESPRFRVVWGRA